MGNLQESDRIIISCTTHTRELNIHQKEKRKKEKTDWDLKTSDEVLPLALALFRATKKAFVSHLAGDNFPEKLVSFCLHESLIQLSSYRYQLLRLFYAPLWKPIPGRRHSSRRSYFRRLRLGMKMVLMLVEVLKLVKVMLMRIHMKNQEMN